MTIQQARESYEFTVPAMKCFGLFVPTRFASRLPFAGNDSNVYQISHGTTNKGASAILAQGSNIPAAFAANVGFNPSANPGGAASGSGAVPPKPKELIRPGEFTMHQDPMDSVDTRTLWLLLSW